MFETKYWRTQEYYAAKRPESGQTEAVRPLPSDGDRQTGMGGNLKLQTESYSYLCRPKFLNHWDFLFYG